MNCSLVILVSLLAIPCPALEEPPADSVSPEELLEEALEVVKTHALRRDHVDWTQVRATAHQQIQGKTAAEDAYDPIRWVLLQLQDGHSFFLPREQAIAWKAPPPAADGEAEPPPLPTGEILEDEIAYVRIPACGSLNDEFTKHYAQTLQDFIRDLDAEVPIGWIVDLRGNVGGNCWPMLAGISSVLGEGRVGSWKSSQNDSPWGVHDGRSWQTEPDNVITEVDRPVTLEESTPWVAVLTDGSTASSGEVITVAFRGRPRCRSFGTPTAGQSTANSDFPLRDGSMLFVTTAVYADRNSVSYGKEIEPDEVIDLPEGIHGEEPEDLVLQRAMEWLRTAYDGDS